MSSNNDSVFVGIWGMLQKHAAIKAKQIQRILIECKIKFW